MTESKQSRSNEKLKNEADIIIERTLNAPIGKVWQAISDRDQMKKWYFDLKEFKAEVGFEFRFIGGTEERKYLHICKIVEVIHLKKLKYSWRYDGYEGISFVTFELFDFGDKAKVRLTHEGLESFPSSNMDFAKENFIAGWTAIVGSSLKEFVETKS